MTGDRRIRHIVNISTPESLEELKTIEDFLDAHNGEVYANSIFPDVQASLRAGNVWKRPGFNFMFFFFDRALAYAFVEATEHWTYATLQLPLEKKDDQIQS